MHDTHRPDSAATPHRPTLGALGLALAIGLAACGGQEGTGDSASPPPMHVTTVAPLVADDGSVLPSDPALTPSDRAARTRAGRYASTAQAVQLEAALGEDMLRVNVACCGDEGIEQAIAIAHGLQAARDLPSSAPVVVRAADLRMGAIAAERLAAGGHTQVWLVTR